ncbi:zinc-ribbon domain-containing protein [Anaerovorax sp. IOR16]|uniref:zinc-ribbon domain-containing protein n=1 Tax=Anaerovorax sp. IOR16 TaxID=2773458 RepID=UPI0019D2A7BA|nr:zinc-ribbon domain-containing protein [Anaerovorax sp. IOR16]
MLGNFNWDDFRNNKIVVKCNTKEEEDDFICKIYEKGYWTMGDGVFRWLKGQMRKNNNFDKQSVYFIYGCIKQFGTFLSKHEFADNRYKIIEWSDYMNSVIKTKNYYSKYICSKCRTEVYLNDKFCRNCGIELKFDENDILI